VAALRDDAIDAAQRTLAKDGVVQLSLPNHVAPKLPDVNLSGLDTQYLKYFLWTVLAVVAIIIVSAIWRRVRALPKRGPVRAAGGPSSVWRPERQQALVLLSEADSLAKGGRFAEAAHLLLLRSVEQIAAKQPTAVKPALTSRDIAAQPSLPRDVSEAFGMITAAVERSLFAGRGIDATEWSRCRAAYADAALGREWA
jgi:hypothetical protein